MKEKDARFMIETNREYIIFWAVIFFTCVVGIIELLPAVKWLGYLTLKFFLISALYFGLLAGIIISLHRGIGIFFQNCELTRGGYAGRGLQEYVEDRFTLFDRLLHTKGKRGRKGQAIENIILLVTVIFFVALYLSLTFCDLILYSYMYLRVCETDIAYRL